MTVDEYKIAVPWVALVGRRRDRRVENALILAHELRKRGLTVGGSIQVDSPDDDGFDIFDLRYGYRIPLARECSNPAECDMCDYRFDRSAFVRARDWVLADPPNVVFAEVGRFEANGRGHWPLVEAALKHPAVQVVVMCIRPHVLGPVGVSIHDPIDGIELPAPIAEMISMAERIRSTLAVSGKRHAA